MQVSEPKLPISGLFCSTKTNQMRRFCVNFLCKLPTNVPCWWVPEMSHLKPQSRNKFSLIPFTVWTNHSHLLCLHPQLFITFGHISFSCLAFFYICLICFRFLLSLRVVAINCIVVACGSLWRRHTFAFECHVNMFILLFVSIYCFIYITPEMDYLFLLKSNFRFSSQIALFINLKILIELNHLRPNSFSQLKSFRTKTNIASLLCVAQLAHKQ